VFGSDGGGAKPNYEYALDKSQILVGISGKYGQYVDNIVLHTSEDDAKTPVRRLGHERGPHAYSMLPADQPMGASIVGFYGCLSNENVAAIGLVCQVPGPPEASLADPDMRWLDSTTTPFPTRDDSIVPAGMGAGTEVPPHGNYHAPAIYRVELDGAALRIWSETGLFRALTFQHVLDDTVSGDTPYLYRDDKGKDVTVKMPGATAGSIELADDLTLVSAAQYETVDSNEPTFGHVFAQPAEVAFDTPTFIGWDVTQIDPTHLQGTEPVRAHLFSYPKDSSRAYHKSEWGKQELVPDGVMYVSDISSDALTQTYFASTEHDFQRSWQVSFGAKLSVGKTDLFKSNTTFRGSVTHNMSTSTSSTVSIFTLHSHVLFADLPRALLDDAFVRDVNALVSAGSAAKYTQFIKIYGTHFAYAVTCGARAYMQAFFSKQTTLDAMSRGVSVETQVGAVFDGLTGSISASASTDVSSGIKTEIHTQKDIYKTEGGDASNAGHLQLGNKPVPILMDLRPITSLLNPVYFADERVYKIVRPKLEQAISSYGASQGTPFSSDSYLPPILSITITTARWKGPGSLLASICIVATPQGQGSMAGKLSGLDFVKNLGFFTSTVWSSSDANSPPMDTDGGDSLLQVTKYIHINGTLPAFSILLGGNTESVLLDPKGFSREPKGGRLDCKTFEFWYQYKLVGKDITWESSASV
jgi:hypothetical protein